MNATPEAPYKVPRRAKSTKEKTTHQRFSDYLILKRRKPGWNPAFTQRKEFHPRLFKTSEEDCDYSSAPSCACQCATPS